MPALIALAYVSLFVFGLLDNIRGPFFPEVLRDLSLNSGVGSLFFAIVSLVSFVGSWSSHGILERHNSRILMAVGGLVMALGFWAIAFAQTVYTLFAACALLGWSFGSLNFTQNFMVVEGTSPTNRRRVMSGLHSMYGLAAFVAPLLANGFRFLDFNWRETFTVVAFLPAGIALWSLWLARQKSFQTLTPEGDSRFTRKDWGLLLACTLIVSGYLWGEISATTRLVVWLRTDHLFTPARANLYLGGFCGLLLLGRVTFTLIHFKWLKNWTILCVSALFSSVLYFIGLRSSPELVVLAGLTMAPFFPVAMDQISQVFGAKSGRALGLILGIGSLSVVLMHVAVGYLSDLIGITGALYVAPAAMIMTAAAIGLILIRNSRA